VNAQEQGRWRSDDRAVSAGRGWFWHAGERPDALWGGTYLSTLSSEAWRRRLQDPRLWGRFITASSSPIQRDLSTDCGRFFLVPTASRTRECFPKGLPIRPASRKIGGCCLL